MFELSNEERMMILHLLNEAPQNVTNISNKIDIRLQQVSRHTKRLCDVGLVERKPDGKYSLTNYGVRILEQIEEISFYAQHRDYFLTHTLENIPREYRIRLRDLSDSKFHKDILHFIHEIDKVISDAKNEICFLVDQFPFHYVTKIRDALDRGVHIRIIEPHARMVNPVLTNLVSELNPEMSRIMTTPHVKQRMLDNVHLFMYLSDNYCAVVFPTSNGENDYRGFTSQDEKGVSWGKDLFQHYWKLAVKRVELDDQGIVRNRDIKFSNGYVVIEGTEDPIIDARILQDAVDNYEKIILSGNFNVGTSTIIVSKDIHIQGDGRVDDIPLTTIKRQGWKFPTNEYDKLFLVEGKGIEVTIENIHFTDWNNACIVVGEAYNVNILKNRLTLQTNIGRGIRFGNLGDQVIGILVAADGQGSFQGGVVIKDNFLDFGTYYILGGFRPRIGLENNPDYRPNLMSHENCISFGIIVKQASSQVLIENNTVRNMNGFSIWTMDNKESAEVVIKNNIIDSGVFGMYPVNSPYAGYGIIAHSHWEASIPNHGFNVKITGNKINFEKVNYCGIAVHGPLEPVRGSVKLRDGHILGNDVRLRDGAVGVLLYHCDSFEVAGNYFSGKAYYGVQVSGGDLDEYLDLRAMGNHIEENNFIELKIKPSDEYSIQNVNGVNFAGENTESVTGHIWLNKCTNNNRVILSKSDLIINNGKNNVLKSGINNLG